MWTFYLVKLPNCVPECLHSYLHWYGMILPIIQCRTVTQIFFFILSAVTNLIEMFLGNYVSMHFHSTFISRYSNKRQSQMSMVIILQMHYPDWSEINHMLRPYCCEATQNKHQVHGRGQLFSFFFQPVTHCQRKKGRKLVICLPPSKERAVLKWAWNEIVKKFSE